MNKNFDDWFHGGYTPETGYHELLREFMHAQNTDAPHDPFRLMHYVIDYHYAYTAMKDYIAELEGKVYALQETIDGPPDKRTEQDDGGF